MVDIGELLGGDRNDTEEQMIQVIEFEQKIANVSRPEKSINYNDLISSGLCF